MSDTDRFDQTFVQAVREAFGIDPSAETVGQLRRAIGRVGVQTAGDLISAVLLACYEAPREADRPLSDVDLRRAVWRVTKEVTREVAHQAAIDPNRVTQPLPAPAPDAAVTAADEFGRVMRAAGGLSDRDLILLGWWAEGWTADQIAAESGMTPAAVRQVISRAVRHIRQAVAAEPPSP